MNFMTGSQPASTNKYSTSRPNAGRFGGSGGDDYTASPNANTFGGSSGATPAFMGSGASSSEAMDLRRKIQKLETENAKLVREAAAAK